MFLVANVAPKEERSSERTHNGENFELRSGSACKYASSSHEPLIGDYGIAAKYRVPIRTQVQYREDNAKQ